MIRAITPQNPPEHLWDQSSVIDSMVSLFMHSYQSINFCVYIYILAKVPALSCRLGHVPYDHAFGVLMGGCAPYDRAFGALIVHSLSITKKLN